MRYPSSRRAVLVVAAFLSLAWAAPLRAQGGAMATGPVFVEFGWARSDLTGSAHTSVAEAVRRFNDLKNSGKKPVVTLSGQTDGSGSPAGNKRLEARRAEAVMHALVTHGVPRESIKISENTDAEATGAPGVRDPNKRTVAIIVEPAT